MSEHDRAGLGPDDVGTSEDVGTRIRQLRQQQGMSLRDMRAALGREGFSISIGGLSKLEKGRQTLTLEAIKALCTVFSVSAEDLLMSSVARNHSQAVVLSAASNKALTQAVDALLWLADCQRGLMWVYAQPGADEVEATVESQVAAHVQRMTTGKGPLAQLGEDGRQFMYGFLDDAKQIGYRVFVQQTGASNDKTISDLHEALLAKPGAADADDAPSMARMYAWGEGTELGTRKNERRDD